MGRFISLVCEFLEVVQLDIVKVSRNAESPLNQIGLPSPPPPSSLSSPPNVCFQVSQRLLSTVDQPKTEGKLGGELTSSLRTAPPCITTKCRARRGHRATHGCLTGSRKVCPSALGLGCGLCAPRVSPIQRLSTIQLLSTSGLPPETERDLTRHKQIRKSEKDEQPMEAVL